MADIPRVLAVEQHVLQGGILQISTLQHILQISLGETCNIVSWRPINLVEKFSLTLVLDEHIGAVIEAWCAGLLRETDSREKSEGEERELHDE